ncbi:hypothetical protein L218DRAFT_992059 [Marasmius fiardii PR-910]|nr:hypothetical protein L218DRAFT_992059 [Marasmius fiardii PR-910]
MSFNHSAGFTIEGGIFNYVQGNQVNHYNRIVEKREGESTPYDEYFKIKIGALCLLKEVNQDVAYERSVKKDKEGKVEGKLVHRVTRIFYTTEIHHEPLSVFTAVAYSGPKAAEAWEDDFHMFSGTHRLVNQLGCKLP